MATGQAEQVEVTDDPGAHRFAATLAGETVGAAYYRIDAGRVVFTHTVISERFNGRGFGSTLARAALDAVRASGREVVPVCPFISAYIARHPAYLDLVPESARGRLPPTG